MWSDSSERRSFTSNGSSSFKTWHSTHRVIRPGPISSLSSAAVHISMFPSGKASRALVFAPCPPRINRAFQAEGCECRPPVIEVQTKEYAQECGYEAYVFSVELSTFLAIIRLSRVFGNSKAAFTFRRLKQGFIYSREGED